MAITLSEPVLRRITVLAALCGVLLAAWAPARQPAGAQSPLDDPGPAFRAARAQLAIESGAPVDAITIARAEPVTWTDGCLGLAASGEFCTQALVDGWALWLRAPDALYRFHANDDGSVIRAAGTVEVPSSIPELPLPTGAILRVGAPAPAPTPAPTGGAGLVASQGVPPSVVGSALALAGAALVGARWLIGRRRDA